MKKYYTVYDMTTYDEQGLDYIQVGLAPVNPLNEIGQMRYNDASTLYSPLLKADDASHIIPPFHN